MVQTTHEVGEAVLVNGTVEGTVIEAEVRTLLYLDHRPVPAVPATAEFYLVELAGGAVEGFTGEYLTAAAPAAAETTERS